MVRRFNDAFTLAESAEKSPLRSARVGTTSEDEVIADAAARGEGHALTQLRWIVGRFGGAGEPGWLAPDEEELREHFTDQFLARFPPDQLLPRITQLAPAMREELIIISATPFTTSILLAFKSSKVSWMGSVLVLFFFGTG